MLSGFVIVMNKNKNEKPKRDLGAEIIAAARSLFLGKGYENTSMRKIAAEVGISPTTIYLYYKDKAEIVHTIHQMGFKMLSDKFKTLRYVKAPFERLKAMGRCYIAFALENPDFYEIMFILEEPLGPVQNLSDDEAGWKEGKEAYETLVEVVEACKEAGYFKGYDLGVLALLIWANMHGLCALNINGHLDLAVKNLNSEYEAEELVRRSFDMYATMLENI